MDPFPHRICYSTFSNLCKHYAMKPCLMRRRNLQRTPLKIFLRRVLVDKTLKSLQHKVNLVICWCVKLYTNSSKIWHGTSKLIIFITVDQDCLSACVVAGKLDLQAFVNHKTLWSSFIPVDFVFFLLFPDVEEMKISTTAVKNVDQVQDRLTRNVKDWVYYWLLPSTKGFFYSHSSIRHSQVFYKPTKWTAPSWLISSVGRTLHCYCRRHLPA